MMSSFQKRTEMEQSLVSINGIPFYCGSREMLMNNLESVCLSPCNKENRIITATGGHGISISRKDYNFAELLKSSYINLPDGIPAVWIGRLKGMREMHRFTGPDFFGYVLQNTANLGIKHYFCGGKQGVAEELQKVCSEKFKNRNVVGTYCPPFRVMNNSELESLANEINEKQVDVLWVGISTPKQEFFARELSKYIKVQFIVTVGAAFDFHTGRVKKAPRLLQKVGLEWAFRLGMEPKRLYKRYFTVVPEMIIYGIKDIIEHNTKKKRS